MVFDMIAIPVISKIELFNCFIEKLAMLFEKCGIMETGELTREQHYSLINDLVHGNKDDQEKAAKYCIDLFEKKSLELNLSRRRADILTAKIGYDLNFLLYKQGESG
jgi:hypothetical protein